MRPIHIIVGLLFAAAFGLVVFGILVQRATTFEPAAEAEAVRRMDGVREAFGGAEPLLVRDASGRIRRRAPAAAPRTREASAAPDPVASLNVLIYRPGDARLARTRIPFWFVKLKGPALGLLLRGSDVDLGSLGVTAADLERAGPGPVLDLAQENGERVLVWTE